MIRLTQVVSNFDPRHLDVQEYGPFINFRSKSWDVDKSWGKLISERTIMEKGRWETRKNKVQAVVEKIERYQGWDGDGFSCDGELYRYFITVKKVDQRDVYGRLKFENLGMRLSLYEFVRIFQWVSNAKAFTRTKLERII